MSVSAIESLEREDCGGNPKTRKEPTEEKLRYHALIVGEGGTRLGGVHETEKYGSEEHNQSTGVWAKRGLRQGSVVAVGDVLHLHRAEVWNPRTQTNQPIMAYCYGHAQTNVLLLPYAPMFHVIPSCASWTTTGTATTTNNNKTASSSFRLRHANVRLEWNLNRSVEELFDRPSDQLFAAREVSGLSWKLVATRDIARGDPLCLDYEHAPTNHGGPTERWVPYDLFPPTWLNQEQRTPVDPVTHQFPFPTVHLPPLTPGQVHPVEWSDNTNQAVSSHMFRVGLPPSLRTAIYNWTQEVGILERTQQYVADKVLGNEPLRDEHEFQLLSDGSWWRARPFYGHARANLYIVMLEDDAATQRALQQWSRHGLDTVLQGMGRYFGFHELTCYEPALIVVNHCIESNLHTDSNNPALFNLLLPLQQVENDPHAELLVGEDLPPDGSMTTANYTLPVAPYTYEPTVALLVGGQGVHATAPADYRDGTVRSPTSQRIVFSLFVRDFTQAAANEEEDDDEEDEQNYLVEEEEHDPDDEDPEDDDTFEDRRYVHWKRNDPLVSVQHPLVVVVDDEA